jgi:steroid delta-isomerase-like uncharacterized protein
MVENGGELYPSRGPSIIRKGMRSKSKGGQSMSEENKAIVRREHEEIWNSQGNLDAADEIYAPNYIGHDPTLPEDIRGVEAARQFAAMYRSAFPDLEFTIEDQIAEGDKVATRLTVRGTHQGELEGIAPTGNRVEITGIVISRIAEGKIAEDWSNFDALGMLQQIGAIPPLE